MGLAGEISDDGPLPPSSVRLARNLVPAEHGPKEQPFVWRDPVEQLVGSHWRTAVLTARRTTPPRSSQLTAVFKSTPRIDAP